MHIKHTAKGNTPDKNVLYVSYIAIHVRFSLTAFWIMFIAEIETKELV
jgi:hypothetical protein